MTAMRYVSKILRGSDTSLLFECPGCEIIHSVQIKEGSAVRWDWNGDVDKPTFKPSLLVRYPWAGEPQVCHSFITDGNIQFLADCTHKLAGQTVPIPDWDLD